MQWNMVGRSSGAQISGGNPDHPRACRWRSCVDRDASRGAVVAFSPTVASTEESAVVAIAECLHAATIVIVAVVAESERSSKNSLARVVFDEDMTQSAFSPAPSRNPSSFILSCKPFREILSSRAACVTLPPVC